MVPKIVRGTTLGGDHFSYDSPTGVSVDSDGLINIADCLNDHIQVF